MFFSFWPKTPEMCHSNRDCGSCNNLESTALGDGKVGLRRVKPHPRSFSERIGANSSEQLRCLDVPHINPEP
jgi:hypothetical protein